MSNHWIITDHKFFMHTSLAKAEAELTRLKEKVPERNFAIYRVKGSLTPSNAPAEIKRLQARTRYFYDVLSDLVNKLELINKDEGHRAVWIVAQSRLGPYTGPQCIKELEEAKKAIEMGTKTT